VEDAGQVDRTECMRMMERAGEKSLITCAAREVARLARNVEIMFVLMKKHRCLNRRDLIEKR